MCLTIELPQEACIVSAPDLIQEANMEIPRTEFYGLVYKYFKLRAENFDKLRLYPFFDNRFYYFLQTNVLGLEIPPCLEIQPVAIKMNVIDTDFTKNRLQATPYVELGYHACMFPDNPKKFYDWFWAEIYQNYLPIFHLQKDDPNSLYRINYSDFISPILFSSSNIMLAADTDIILNSFILPAPSLFKLFLTRIKPSLKIAQAEQLLDEEMDIILNVYCSVYKALQDSNII